MTDGRDERVLHLLQLAVPLGDLRDLRAPLPETLFKRGLSGAASPLVTPRQPADGTACDQERHPQSDPPEAVGSARRRLVRAVGGHHLRVEGVERGLGSLLEDLLGPLQVAGLGDLQLRSHGGGDNLQVAIERLQDGLGPAQVPEQRRRRGEVGELVPRLSEGITDALPVIGHRRPDVSQLGGVLLELAGDDLRLSLHVGMVVQPLHCHDRSQDDRQQSAREPPGRTARLARAPSASSSWSGIADLRRRGTLMSGPSPAAVSDCSGPALHS